MHNIGTGLACIAFIAISMYAGFYILNRELKRVRALRFGEAEPVDDIPVCHSPMAFLIEMSPSGEILHVHEA